MGVVVAVDAVSDVVHIPGNPGQLDGMLPIPQILQKPGGGFRHLGRVLPGMLRIPQDSQDFISPLNQEINLLAAPDHLVGYIIFLFFLNFQHCFSFPVLSLVFNFTAV